MSQPDIRSPLSFGLAGFARAMDLCLVLPRKGDYERIKAGDRSVLAAFCHEWVHYFQFVSTNLGRVLVDLHHAQWVTRYQFSHSMHQHHGWDFSVPAFEWPPQDDLPQNGSVTSLRYFLKDIERVFADQFTYYAGRGYLPNSKLPLPSVHLVPDRHSRSGTIQLGNWHGQITTLQIMEHAAVTAESLYDGFSYERFFDANAADYFFGYWFLIQRGIVRLKSKEGKTKIEISGCSFHSQSASVPALMFLFTQIALNVGELVEVSFSGTEEWRQRMDPGNFLIRSGAMGRLAGFVFCDLLENFETCAKAVIKEYDASGSWIKAACAVCSLRGYPCYESAIKIGIAQVSDALKNYLSMVPQASDPLRFMFGTVRSTMLEGLKNLLANESANVVPLLEPGSIPFPKTVVYSEQGERRILALGFPWLKSTPKYIEASKNTLSFIIEEERILEALCHEPGIACYPSNLDHEIAQAFAVWQCGEFMQCRQARQNGDKNFCTNSGWMHRRRRTGYHAYLKEASLGGKPDTPR